VAGGGGQRRGWPVNPRGVGNRLQRRLGQIHSYHAEVGPNSRASYSARPPAQPARTTEPCAGRPCSPLAARLRLPWLAALAALAAMLAPVWCQISIKRQSDGNEAEVGAISAAHFGRDSLRQAGFRWTVPWTDARPLSVGRRGAHAQPLALRRATRAGRRYQLRRLAMVEAQHPAESFSPRHRCVVVGGCGERCDQPVGLPARKPSTPSMRLRATCFIYAPCGCRTMPPAQRPTLGGQPRSQARGRSRSSSRSPRRLLPRGGMIASPSSFALRIVQTVPSRSLRTKTVTAGADVARSQSHRRA
jgi:hypothetical protein